MISISVFVGCTRVRLFPLYDPHTPSLFPSPLLYTSCIPTENLIIPSAEKSTITDPKAIEENLALGEHVKKGTYLAPIYTPGTLIDVGLIYRGTRDAQFEKV